MRKSLTLLLALTFILVLAACGSDGKEEAKEETKTFVDEFGESEITITFVGDKLISQTTKVELPYEVLDIETKEEAEEVFSGEGEMEEIKGFTTTNEFTESSVVMQTEMVVDEIEEEDKAMFEFNDENEMSVEKIIKELEEAGYTEK